MATWTGPAHAICAAFVDPSYLDDVLEDPKSLLRTNPRGGDLLVFKIRQLAVNGTRILKEIGRIAPQANPQQKLAIGRGLAIASGACTARSPEIARQISELVRASGDRDVVRAYTSFFSATEDNNSQLNTTSTINPQADQVRRLPNMGSGFSPRTLPLGNPFDKP